MKKSASEVIAYLIIFVILFGLFASSYFFIYPLIKKTRSKSELKSIENDIIDLANKLSKSLNDKVSSYMNFVISKGYLTLDKSVFGIKYTVTVPYSPYSFLWYDIINNKPAQIDACEIISEDQILQVKNCLAKTLNAQCKKVKENLYNCFFPIFNINIPYIKVRKSDITGTNEEGYLYISTKPLFKVTDKKRVCSVYVNSFTKNKNEKLTYYVICNIRKVGNTCYIPNIEGNIVASPVTSAKLVIEYKGEKYLPNFNYFGCNEAYIQTLNLRLIRS